MFSQTRQLELWRHVAEAPRTEEDDVKGVEAERRRMPYAADYGTIWYCRGDVDWDVLVHCSVSHGEYTVDR